MLMQHYICKEKDYLFGKYAHYIYSKGESKTQIQLSTFFTLRNPTQVAWIDQEDQIYTRST